MKPFRSVFLSLIFQQLFENPLLHLVCAVDTKINSPFCFNSMNILKLPRFPRASCHSSLYFSLIRHMCNLELDTGLSFIPGGQGFGPFGSLTSLLWCPEPSLESSLQRLKVRLWVLFIVHFHLRWTAGRGSPGILKTWRSSSGERGHRGRLLGGPRLVLAPAAQLPAEHALLHGSVVVLCFNGCLSVYACVCLTCLEYSAVPDEYRSAVQGLEDPFPTWM